MNRDGFNKLYWGFFFIMINFKIQGFDIFPNIIGYILFALGLGILSSRSAYFEKAKGLNIFMIILSIFSIYERPVQGSGIRLGYLGGAGILVGIAAIILNLVMVYYLFKGIQDMAASQDQMYIREEADRRWTQYAALQIAGFFAFILIFVPLINIIYIWALLAATIVLAFVIMGFMRRCGESII